MHHHSYRYAQYPLHVPAWECALKQPSNVIHIHYTRMQYALRSQHSWQNAKDNGYFDKEIVPVEIKDKKVSKMVARSHIYVY